jgi:hypothetical protein
MPLPAIVTALDQVPEAVRSEYRPGRTDEGLSGKWVLDVAPSPDGWSLENVTGLKAALNAERKQRESAEASARVLERLRSSGIDPDKVPDSLARLAELEKLDPAKEADKLAEAKATARIEKVVRESQSAIAERDLKLAKLSSALQNAIRKSAIDAALAGANVLNAEAVRLKVQSAIRVRETDADDEPFAVEVVDAKGDPVYDRTGQPMTVSGFVESLKADPVWSSAFAAESKSGAGVTLGGTGSRSMRRADFDRLEPFERVAAMKNGVVLTD